MQESLSLPNDVPAPEEALSAEARLDALCRQLAGQMEKTAAAEASRRNDLDERENALQRRELLSRARAEMEKRGLSPALAECMAFSDEGAMQESIDRMERGFRAAVQAAVEARLLDTAPKTSPLRPLSELSDEEYYAAVCCK